MRKSGVFGLVGLILGATGAIISITAIVFGSMGLAFSKKNVRPRIR